jgi:hypothetical protein
MRKNLRRPQSFVWSNAKRRLDQRLKVNLRGRRDVGQKLRREPVVGLNLDHGAELLSLGVITAHAKPPSRKRDAKKSKQFV